jgi:hypothetical protein
MTAKKRMTATSGDKPDSVTLAKAAYDDRRGRKLGGDCGVKHPDHAYYCTRLANHKGQHGFKQADGKGGRVTVIRWGSRGPYKPRRRAVAPEDTCGNCATVLDGDSYNGFCGKCQAAAEAAMTEADLRAAAEAAPLGYCVRCDGLTPAVRSVTTTGTDPNDSEYWGEVVEAMCERHAAEVDAAVIRERARATGHVDDAVIEPFPGTPAEAADLEAVVTSPEFFAWVMADEAQGVRLDDGEHLHVFGAGELRVEVRR